MIWKIQGNSLFQIQLNQLKRLGLNQKFGLYRMGLGFDIIHQIKHLQIIPTGIRVKSMFKPFTNVLKLYGLSETT